MESIKKALIVGGNGFIGSHLADSLVTKGWNVTVFDIYPRKFSVLPNGVNFIQADSHQSYEEIVKTIDENKPDNIFYLAWKTTPEIPLKIPNRDINNNISPVLNIINYCARTKIKLVFISSGGAVYGSSNKQKIIETDETNPISPYGVEKLMVEKYLFMYRQIYGLNYVTIRPSNPFGPWQDYKGKQGAVAIFLYRIAKGLPVTLWGDGNTIRDYFYISDLTDAIISSAEQQTHDGRRIFNVGGGEGITLNQLINQIEIIVGKKIILDRFPMRKIDPPSIILDNSLIRSELGWEPKISIDIGLKKTWEWMAKVI